MKLPVFVRMTLVAIVAIVLSSCGGGDGDGVDDATSAASTPDATTAPPATTAAPATVPQTTVAATTPPTTVPQTTVAPTTAPPTTVPPTTTPPDADRGFADADFDDPATAAALSVRAGAAFLLLSDVFIDCLDDAMGADAAAVALVDEMVAAERGQGLSVAAADLAASCMAEPGYVDDVRDSWIGTETDPAVADCLRNLFDVTVDIAATSASLQIDVTEADIGGVTMESALSCSASELLQSVLEDAGLVNITVEESQCIGSALAQTQASGASQFRPIDFLDCLTDGSHNDLALTQFRFDAVGGEGRCLNESVANRADPDSRVIGVDAVLAAHSACATLGRFINEQNGGRLDDDAVACINETAKGAPPVSNAELNDLINGCVDE